jgi:hypothetical protein
MNLAQPPNLTGGSLVLSKGGTGLKNQRRRPARGGYRGSAPVRPLKRPTSHGASSSSRRPRTLTKEAR